MTGGKKRDGIQVRRADNGERSGAAPTTERGTGPGPWHQPDRSGSAGTSARPPEPSRTPALPSDVPRDDLTARIFRTLCHADRSHGCDCGTNADGCRAPLDGITMHPSNRIARQTKAIRSLINAETAHLKAEIARLAGRTPAPASERSEASDDLAVDRFAETMKRKLAVGRAKGRGGWEDERSCPVGLLARMLVEHVPKGDPVDIANLAMMVHQRGHTGNGGPIAVAYARFAEEAIAAAAGRSGPEDMPGDTLGKVASPWNNCAYRMDCEAALQNEKTQETRLATIRELVSLAWLGECWDGEGAPEVSRDSILEAIVHVVETHDLEGFDTATADAEGSAMLERLDSGPVSALIFRPEGSVIQAEAGKNSSTFRVRDAINAQKVEIERLTKALAIVASAAGPMSHVTRSVDAGEVEFHIGWGRNTKTSSFHAVLHIDHEGAGYTILKGDKHVAGEADLDAGETPEDLATYLCVGRHMALARRIRDRVVGLMREEADAWEATASFGALAKQMADRIAKKLHGADLVELVQQTERDDGAR
jgi:hypothetical protein